MKICRGTFEEGYVSIYYQRLGAQPPKHSWWALVSISNNEALFSNEYSKQI
jgi:hypothetical protein